MQNQLSDTVDRLFLYEHIRSDDRNSRTEMTVILHQCLSMLSILAKNVSMLRRAETILQTR